MQWPLLSGIIGKLNALNNTTMSMMKEFKEFAMRGNVMDLAIAVVIGAAFGRIVTSLVNDVIMPPIGLLTGGVDFSELKLIMKDPVVDANGAVVTEAVSINYGLFIQTIISFLIIAIAVFMIVKVMNNLKRKKAESPSVPPAPTKEEVLLTEIRDALRAR